jgi:methylthioribulose-1-phosphate dehydratase
MAKTYDQTEPRAALAAIAREFYARGWMPGTAGNLSVRCGNDANAFWITVSGLPKGQLDDDDFIRVNVREGGVVERLRPEHKPSAETSIHRAIYSLFPIARACLHVHSVDTCIALGRLPHNATSMRLPPLEVVKGLGIWQEQPQVDMPVFANWLDVPRIAQDIEQRFRLAPPAVSALVIREHGITVWGESLQEAFNRVEIVEFISTYLARV